MSATTTALADALLSSVPKLDPTGSNWTVFLFYFQDAVDTKGFWGHFDGSSPKPELSAEATEAQLAAKTQWEKDECSSKSLLTQKLPDLMMVLIHSKMTVKERWEVVVQEYMSKSEYAKMGLRAKFLGMRCTDKGSVREFLEGLQLKREELSQAGVDIDKKDYFSVIISSIPAAMLNFASSQLAAAHFSGTKIITSNDLISILLEEADRQKVQFAQCKGSGKGKDEVLVVGEKERKGREKGRRMLSAGVVGRKDISATNVLSQKKTKS